MNIVEHEKKEQAILVGVVHKNQTYEDVEEYLNELALLADTAGAENLTRQIQERNEIDPAFFFGRGKAETLALLIKKQAKSPIKIWDKEKKKVI